jgi:hypothetical protein
MFLSLQTKMPLLPNLAYANPSQSVWAAFGSGGGGGGTGPIGPTGPAGATGPQGLTGVQGPTGFQGATGPTPTGTGPGGPTGPAGPTGAAGAAGAAGATGPLGGTGPAGPAGATGSAGGTGPLGGTGPVGAAGSTGPQGSQGPPGVTGGILTSLIVASTNIYPVPAAPAPPYSFGIPNPLPPTAGVFYDVTVRGILNVTGTTSPGPDDSIAFTPSVSGVFQGTSTFILYPGQTNTGTGKAGPLRVGDSVTFTWFGRLLSAVNPNTGSLTMLLTPGGPPSASYTVEIESMSALQVWAYV